MTIDQLRNLFSAGSVLDVVVIPTLGGYHVWADTIQGREAIETVRGTQRTWKHLVTLERNLSDRGIGQWRFEDQGDKSRDTFASTVLQGGISRDRIKSSVSKNR